MKKLFRMALMMSAAAVSLTVASCGGGGGGGGGTGFVGAALDSMEGYVLTITDNNTMEWPWTRETWTFTDGLVSLEGTFWTQASGGVPVSSSAPVSYIYQRISGDKAQIIIQGVKGHVTGAVVDQFTLDTVIDLTFNDADDTVIVECAETFTWPDGQVHKPNSGQRIQLKGEVIKRR